MVAGTGQVRLFGSVNQAFQIEFNPQTYGIHFDSKPVPFVSIRLNRKVFLRVKQTNTSGNYE